MFLVFRKKLVFSILCALLCISMVVVYFTAIRPTFKPALIHTIVIDAGHGGKDGGAVGRTTGVTESELNLQYSLTLKDICEQYGFKVVLTRSDMNGLYSPFASNKKRSEMEKRKEIIDKTNPDLVISIHMNSFTSSSAQGAQVFYADGCESGQALAQSVQTNLYNTTQNAKKTAKIGDYYILNCTKIASILVECGYLTNTEEEVLLQQEDYRNKLCYNILCGVLLYFNMK